MRSQLRHPHDEGREIVIRVARQYLLLNFERPPKTEPSSWANEHHDAHLVGVAVKCSAQWLTTGAKIIEVRGG